MSLLNGTWRMSILHRGINYKADLEINGGAGKQSGESGLFNILNVRVVNGNQVAFQRDDGTTYSAAFTGADSLAGKYVQGSYSDTFTLTRARATPTASTASAAGAVWMMSSDGRLFVGDFSESVDRLGRKQTAHVTMYEKLIAHFSAQYGQALAIQAAGSIKADGSFAGNSAFNNPEVSRLAVQYNGGMDGPLVNSGGATGTPWEQARMLAVSSGDKTCSPQQLAAARQLYANRQYTTIN